MKIPLPQRTRLINQTGFSLPMVLSMILVFVILSTSVIGVIQSNLFAANNNVQRQKALNIAEAGLNYYLWHLSHNSTDFKDGKTTPSSPDPALGYGPYLHTYIDDSGINEGTYTLWIKPQGSGSTIATVRSIGQIKNSSVIRTVEAQIGAPSFASYVLAGDSEFWFGNTETANGPVHSNVGVHLDGANTTDVTSANASYVPSASYGGDGSTQPGVWCSPSVTTPVNCNTRDKSSWRYPVPSVDFNQITGSLCTMKKAAFADYASTSALAGQANACTQTPTTRTNAYLPQRAVNGSFSLTKGYLVELNPGGTYNLYNVNAENDRSVPYTSALTLQSVASNITLPPSGVIFAEDNVWVRSNSTFKGRVTIAAGRLATNSNANIVIADNLLYSTKNGTDAIGLVAEDSVIIAPYAIPSTGAFNFEVDAAMIAQSGNIMYPSTYRTSSSRCTYGWVNSNQTLSFYGAIATRQLWTWTWLVGNSPCGDAVSSSGTYIAGVKNNTTTYDYNLLYAPPPSFPSTSSYAILSWREVLTLP